MTNFSVIQKYLAFAMLLLFTFSMTPKKYLHDLVSNHEDFYSLHFGDETTVNQIGFHCQCEDLVVSTPFIQVSFGLNISSSYVYEDLASSDNIFLFLNTYTTKDSRGPPSIA